MDQIVSLADFHVLNGCDNLFIVENFSTSEWAIDHLLFSQRTSQPLNQEL